MEFFPILWRFIESSVTPAILVVTAFWQADRLLLSDTGAKILFRAIENTAKFPRNSETAKTLKNFLNSYFSIDNGLFSFYFNVFIFTAVSVLVILAIYTSKTIGLFNQLFAKEFLFQFLFNGFIVTYLCNFLSFAYYQILIEKIAFDNISKSMLVLLLDILAKISLFILLSIISYIFFATFFGAFSGDEKLALKAIPTTLLHAIQFKNLSGVYFYSVAISSFPIYFVIIINIMIANPNASRAIRHVLFWLPFESKPIRAVATIFGIFIGIFALIASTLLALFT